MGLPKTQFSIWLRQQLFGQEERCRKIIVRHATATARIGNVLFSIDVPNAAPDDANWDEWVREHVDLLENIMQADADGTTNGVEKYVIQTYVDGDNKPSATFSARFAGEAPEDDGIQSEPATKTGVLSQLMRHNEVLMRLATIGTGNTMNAMAKTMAKQESVIEKLLNEKFDNITLVEQLFSQKQERDIDAAKASHEIEMKEKLFDKALLLLPTVVNKLAGKNGQKLLPEESNPVEQSIHSFAGSITEPQLEALQKILTPEQQLALFEVFNSVNEKQSKLLPEKSESDKESD